MKLLSAWKAYLISVWKGPDLPAAFETQMRVNARTLHREFEDRLGRPVAWGREGVEHLDGIIEGERHGWDEATKQRLVALFGSYLGVSIIEEYGGRWIRRENDFGIELFPGFEAFPLSKVLKHIEDGSEDSVLGFFNALASAREISSLAKSS